MTHIEDEWRALRESIKKTEISNYIQRETRIERLIGENIKIIEEKEETEQKHYLEMKVIRKEKKDEYKRMVTQVRHLLVANAQLNRELTDQRDLVETLLKRKTVDK